MWTSASFSYEKERVSAEEHHFFLGAEPPASKRHIIRTEICAWTHFRSAADAVREPIPEETGTPHPARTEGTVGTVSLPSGGRISASRSHAILLQNREIISYLESPRTYALTPVHDPWPSAGSSRLEDWRIAAIPRRSTTTAKAYDDGLAHDRADSRWLTMSPIMHSADLASGIGASGIVNVPSPIALQISFRPARGGEFHRWSARNVCTSTHDMRLGIAPRNYI
jgi:hypothetical protein